MTSHPAPRGSGQYSDIDNDEHTPHDQNEGYHLSEWRSNESEFLSLDREKSVPFTQEEEQRVVGKLDKRLVLFVALLYLLSFLDRSNIGNAKAAGLEEDLHLTGEQFHWILDGFYITYILFEFMTICYRIFPAHIYISVCVCAMGTIAALQSTATSYRSLFILRLCLGIAEAAFGPGIPFYLSYFFKRDELARRTGIFIAAAPLGSSVAGSLAWIILRLARGSGFDGWRLLFVVEGFPNVLLAVAAWHIIPDSPGTTRWLNHRERKIAVLRLNKSPGSHSQLSETDGLQPENKARKGLDWGTIATTLKDPKNYVVALILFSLNVAFSSLPVFLPTIVHNMGFSRLSAQGMSAIPNLCAFVVVLVTATLSDRHKTRSLPLAFHAVLAMLGYALLATSSHWSHNALRYLCLFPITAGFFSAVTMVVVWVINNQDSDEGKAVGSSILQVFGHVGSLLGQQLYPDSEAPFFVRSHAVCAGFMGVAAILALVLRGVLIKANRRGEIGGRGAFPNGEGEGEEDGAGAGGDGEALMQGGTADDEAARVERFRYFL